MIASRLNRSDSGDTRRQSTSRGLVFTAEEVLGIFRNRWKYGLAVAVLVAANVAIYLMTRPEMYRAQATLLLESQPDRVLNIEQVIDTSVNRQFLQLEQNNAIEQMRGSAFRKQVLTSMPEDLRERMVAPFREIWDPTVSPGEVFATQFSASAVHDTQFFDLRFVHPDPQVAADIANHAASEYLRYKSTRNEEGIGKALAFLEEQTEHWRARVEESDKALQRYRQEHNLVSLDETQNIVTERMKALSDSLTQLDLEMESAEARITQVERRLASEESLLAIPEIANFGDIPEIRRRLAEAIARREILEGEYLEQHPLMQENTTTRRAYREELASAIQDAVSELRGNHEQIVQRRKYIARQLDEAERQALALDEKAIQYKVLQRDLETNTQVYTQVLNRLNETHLAQRLNHTNLRIADIASPPGKPFAPDPIKAGISAGFAFVLLFVLVPVGMDLLDGRARTRDQVEKLVQAELLGAVPVQRRSRRTPVDRAVIDHTNPDLIESFRHVYTSFLLESGMRPHSATVVTSCLPGEGKSFFTSNIAACFAAHGARTLILDLDLRRPRQHQIFDSDSEESGLLPWFRSGTDTGGNLLENDTLGILPLTPQLHMLRAGGATRHASEIIRSERFKSLLRRAKAEFDHVIIDTPPAGLFSDALLAANEVEYAIIVVHHNRTTRRNLKEITERMSRTGATLVGAVFNQVRGMRRDAGYYNLASAREAKYYSQRGSKIEESREQEVLKHVG